METMLFRIRKPHYNVGEIVSFMQSGAKYEGKITNRFCELMLLDDTPTLVGYKYIVLLGDTPIEINEEAIDG